MNYQGTWEDGTLIQRGERDCADRYKAIRAIAATLPIPFNVLDLGANLGYFSVRLSETFDCDVTAVDDLERLRDVESSHIRVISQRVDATWLARQKRHDLALALSVLHHMTDWREVLTELTACRHASIIEVPHPDESWFRSAAARYDVTKIYQAVHDVASKQLGEFERVGRDRRTYLRPMFLVPGRVRTHVGVVFTGSGANSRWMHRYGNRLPEQLGYEPYWGSLNIRLPEVPDLGPPAIDYLGRRGERTRDYQFWRAWIRDVPCHVMVPGNRSHGPDCLEIVAPIRLRDRYDLADGQTLPVDVEVNTP
jgi:hypothetical protein